MVSCIYQMHKCKHNPCFRPRMKYIQMFDSFHNMVKNMWTPLKFFFFLLQSLKRTQGALGHFLESALCLNCELQPSSEMDRAKRAVLGWANLDLSSLIGLISTFNERHWKTQMFGFRFLFLFATLFPYEQFVHWITGLKYANTPKSWHMLLVYLSLHKCAGVCVWIFMLPDWSGGVYLLKIRAPSELRESQLNWLSLAGVLFHQWLSLQWLNA